MSTSIIYSLELVRVPGSLFGDQVEDHYLQLEESGSSNSYDFTGRRSRSKCVQFFGTRDDVIAYAIACGRSFEGGMTKWRCMGSSGTYTRIGWIKKIERMLVNPQILEIRVGTTSAGIKSRSDYFAVSSTQKDEPLEETLRKMYVDSQKLNNTEGVYPSYWRYLNVT